MSRYDVDTAETRYQPRSNDQVLVNKLGIIDVGEMEDIEANLLMKLYKQVFSYSEPLIELRFQTILDWHRQWLGNVYPWAGTIRNVRMWKGDFEFATPLQISRLAEFRTRVLVAILQPHKSQFG